MMDVTTPSVFDAAKKSVRIKTLNIRVGAAYTL
jgi:hypothetical protein